MIWSVAPEQVDCEWFVNGPKGREKSYMRGRSAKVLLLLFPSCNSVSALPYTVDLNNLITFIIIIGIIEPVYSITVL